MQKLNWIEFMLQKEQLVDPENKKKEIKIAQTAVSEHEKRRKIQKNIRNTYNISTD